MSDFSDNTTHEIRGKNHTLRNIVITVFATVLLIPVIYTAGMLIFDSGLVDDEMDVRTREEKYPQYKSSVDKDGDGVDDQTDILESAKAYLKTKPQYKSEYYAGGYPNGKYGVCTDVVAFALKGAGYDLRKLLDADVTRAPGKYGLTARTKDSAIDFRRVGNQAVYFKRHAKSLTTDLGKPEEWQGGDIVVFKAHVAVVSDKRNHKGIPYILHLANPLQTKLHQYEQNGLEKRKNHITGHFRIS